jgi:hypothetical protein
MPNFRIEGLHEEIRRILEVQVHMIPPFRKLMILSHLILQPRPDNRFTEFLIRTFFESAISDFIEAVIEFRRMEQEDILMLRDLYITPDEITTVLDYYKFSFEQHLRTLNGHQ